MNAKLVEHLLSLALVTAIGIGAIQYYYHHTERRQQQHQSARHELAAIDSALSLDSPFDRALLRDVLDVYYPEQRAQNRQTVEELLQRQQQALTRHFGQAHLVERLSADTLRELLWMFLRFVAVYAFVTALVYYGVQTLGVWQFVHRKAMSERGQPQTPSLARPRAILRSIGAAAGGMILFSPAYVIAYAIRTEFSTDSLLFLILLGVVSNGLLITYAQKFYSFCKAESRRGYVETAKAKNLCSTYDPSRPDGIAPRDILRFRKRFDNHLFGHVFANARYQYLATLKEQSSFLITGLIIIEMALNIHGHLSYEMLRQMLYGNLDIVIAIILGIFYVVKSTEIGVDYAIHRLDRRYANARG
jgi:hypothetical protein